MPESERQGGAATATPLPAASDGLVHEPRQERSRRTLERILAAGLELLGEDGPDALTVTGITRRARTSVGSFYARFDGKDDLVRYLGERALEEALAEWERATEAMQETDLRAGAQAMVGALGSLHLEGPGRALALLAGQEDPPPTRRLRFEARLAGELQRVSSASRTRADLAARIVVGLLHDAVRRGGRSASDEVEAALPEPEVLLDELSELIVGYLGGKPASPGRVATGAAQADAANESEPVPPSGEDAGEEAEVDAPDPFDIWE